MDNILELYYDILSSDLDINEQNEILTDLLNNEQISIENSLIRICILNIVKNYDLQNIMNGSIPDKFVNEILMRKIIHMNKCICLHNYQINIYTNALSNLKKMDNNISKKYIKDKITNNYITLWYNNYIELKLEIESLPFNDIRNIFENNIKKLENITMDYCEF